MKGCIHIYCGDGKGKTTAAAGLAVRFSGYGKQVLIAQFLKDGSSGEIKVLNKIPGITVHSYTRSFGFSFRMDEEQKKEAAACYTKYLQDVLEEAVQGNYGLLILDEAVGAYDLGFLDKNILTDFLKEKPEEMEVVLTGRNPAVELVELADYVSEVQKKKHPFDVGVPAREGIEW